MTIDAPGFADPVADSQSCFRDVLDATARPGTIGTVAAPASPPAPLDRATAAVLLTLVDVDTKLWIGPALAAAWPWIGFHCGAPAAPLAEAAFVLGLGTVDWSAVAAGSDDGPEDGATVVLQVDSLHGGPPLVLEGPGLAAPVPFHATLPPGFAAVWAGNRARFPRGFDVILCAGDQLAALPRTLTVREG